MTTTIYTNNHRLNLTRYWQQHYPNWSIPIGFVVHHIKPQSEGGSHNPKNLIALHPDDHVSIHKCRGDKFAHNWFTVMKDYKHSEETKKKIKQTNIDFWNSDKSISAKKKIREANKGRTCLQGFKHSEETKENMSKAAKKRGVLQSTNEAGTKKLKELYEQGITPNMDRTIYTFINIKTDEIFTGLRVEFSKLYNISTGSSFLLVNGKTKQTRSGWTIKSK